MNPQDFYVKPQFLAQIDDYLDEMVGMIQFYNQDIGGTATNDFIQQVSDFKKYMNFA